MSARRLWQHLKAPGSFTIYDNRLLETALSGVAPGYDGRLAPAARLTYLALLSLIRLRQTSAHVEDLAGLLGFSPKTVRRALEDLEACGLVQKGNGGYEAKAPSEGTGGKGGGAPGKKFPWRQGEKPLGKGFSAAPEVSKKQEEKRETRPTHPPKPKKAAPKERKPQPEKEEKTSLPLEDLPFWGDFAEASRPFFPNLGLWHAYKRKLEGKLPLLGKERFAEAVAQTLEAHARGRVRNPAAHLSALLEAVAPTSPSPNPPQEGKGFADGDLLEFPDGRRGYFLRWLPQGGAFVEFPDGVRRMEEEAMREAVVVG